MRSNGCALERSRLCRSQALLVVGRRRVVLKYTITHPYQQIDIGYIIRIVF